MTTHKEFLNYDPVKPVKDVFRCRGCGTIYRSADPEPNCPTDQQRCKGTIQRATRRTVG